jgi:hypothetical protein
VVIGAVPVSQIWRVPQLHLWHGRVQPKLAKDTRAGTVIGRPGVPKSLMKDHDGPSWTMVELLTGEMLIPRNIVHVDSPKMATWDVSGSTLSGLNIMGKPEQLDVEGQAVVDDGVAMQPLRGEVARLFDVHEVVINNGTMAD